MQVAYTGHAQLKSDPLPAAPHAYFPVQECRRAFDVVAGKGAPLRRALREVQPH